jgi:uncharacterized membrane protein (UPF0182 family)
VIEYQWWKELEQIPTLFSGLLYGILPVTAAAIIASVIFYSVHVAATRVAGREIYIGRRSMPFAILAALVLGVLVSLITIDSWTIVRYFGGRGMETGAAAWTDPVFGRPLSFYFFELPFYQVLLSWITGVALLTLLIFWLTARLWVLRSSFSEWSRQAEFDLRELFQGGPVDSLFFRGVAASLVLVIAAHVFLGRYDMLFAEHGALVGIDWVDENVALPLRWLTIGACLLAVALIAGGRAKWAIPLALVLLIQAFVPRIVHAAYVRPNEIVIQRPYIKRHIDATRTAYRIDQRAREIDFNARLESRIDPAKHKPLFDNVRLWDWRAFHDTITQIQALRPYYTFPDTDVDRYMIGGQIRQMLLAPRDLDIRQMAEARTRWVNPHFIYTHGYGLVMAEAARITAEGLPYLIAQNAPPEVSVPDLKLTRPELYYSEVVHEPVFVRTEQPEFDYPAGSDKVDTHYGGRGGISVASFPMRLAAALYYADHNIILTSLFTPESRMMLRRNIKQRLQTLAGFIQWDQDPYLVVSDAGRLVWICDGYTTSPRHPYSQKLRLQGAGEMNYVRNSVKATIDAYDGSVNMYVFDEADPILRAWRNIFTHLFRSASEMPADLRRHARYPETIFRIQAEIYRTYHMTEPDTFYNKEDLWDVARSMYGSGDRPEPMPPTFVVATVPGATQPEFLLMIPFTPRNKDNMIGLMVARCDGENLGELYYLHLSKQTLILGPMQIEARINQDQVIAKDLSLWNQQGSRVLRGQMLVLPIEDTFLYVEPIYIQANEARMPQLRKVVLAMGNRLIYADTYEQALAELASGRQAPAEQAVTVSTAATPGAAPSAAVPQQAPGASAAQADRITEGVRQHLRRYRELAAQGRWGEAGRELEALEALVNQRR